MATKVKRSLWDKVKDYAEEVTNPPKKGKGSSGTGTGMLDDTARKAKKHNKAVEDAAKLSKNTRKKSPYGPTGRKTFKA